MSISFAETEKGDPIPLRSRRKESGLLFLWRLRQEKGSGTFPLNQRFINMYHPSGFTNCSLITP